MVGRNRSNHHNLDNCDSRSYQDDMIYAVAHATAVHSYASEHATSAAVERMCRLCQVLVCHRVRLVKVGA